MASARPKENVRKARSELYRQIILEAAEGCFAEKGIEETKMEEVAAESGLSLGTVYSVFSGKAELVTAIHETRLRDILRRAVRVAVGHNDPLEALLLGVRAYVEFFVLHPNYLRMHLRDGHAWGLGQAAAPDGDRADAWSDGVAMLAALFARGAEQGVFYRDDPRLMARMMIAMQQVQLASWLDDGGRRDPEALLADIEIQVHRSFCSPPAS